MATTAKVAISSNFLVAFAALPRKIQGKVTDFMNKFMNNPQSPGINYEKLKNTLDSKICSVRIDDTYRGIVARQADVYLLLWVAHHNSAYDWAAKRKCEVNPKTGALQVFDVQEIVVEKTVEGIFSKVGDEELLQLAVPRDLLPLVRSFTSKDAFFASKNQLPQDAYEALSWVADDFPVAEVLELLDAESKEPNNTDDLAGALEMPETMKNFVVLEGEEELRNIMSAPLDMWRIFLHPTQRKLAHKGYSGPARVLGGAGTGKTVVAMHRAKYLAKQLKQRERIMFTTFTANLAADIQENLRQLCSVDELKRIDIINLDAWIGKFFHDNGYNAKIIYEPNEIAKMWDEAIADADEQLGLETDFYEEEWRRVVVAQECYTLPSYAKAPRVGRGMRLDRKKRIAIWKVMEAYMNLCKDKHVRDIDYAMYECTALLRHKYPEGMYRHIIVDEGQDLSDSAFRLLRALAGEEKSDDIFIVGDAHQRIYKNHAVLSKCGINVRGRSSILKINYRTTEEIRTYALALLQGITFDDMDDSIDVGDKCKSLTHGQKPFIKCFSTMSDEADFLEGEIEKLHSNGVPYEDICIVARTHKYLDAYINYINEKGMKCYEISRSKKDNRKYEGVRMATMHRVKGLEFPYVFITAANDRVIPLASALRTASGDEIAKKEAETAEKCLLYVAMTRAKTGVYMTCYGKASEYLGTDVL